MFKEVWGLSYCRTIEKLVEVVQEYPTEVEHIYSPACVSLVRCSGCCGDENQECHPTQTTNVTMQVPLVEFIVCWVFVYLLIAIFIILALENKTSKARSRIC